MTLDKANELLATHANLGGGYNRNAVKMILAEIMRDYGQAQVDELIIKYDMQRLWQFKPGMVFKSDWPA